MRSSWCIEIRTRTRESTTSADRPTDDAISIHRATDDDGYDDDCTTA